MNLTQGAIKRRYFQQHFLATLGAGLHLHPFALQFLPPFMAGQVLHVHVLLEHPLHLQALFPATLALAAGFLATFFVFGAALFAATFFAKY